MPAPSVRRRSARVKRSKTLGPNVLGNARPVVVDLQHASSGPSLSSETVTVLPAGVCRRALASRLAST